MDSDIRPAKEPNRPLQTALGNRIAPEAEQPKPAEAEVFRTPEEIAATQTLEQASEAIGPAGAPQQPQVPRNSGGLMQKLKSFWPPSKKGWIIIAGVVLVLASVTGFALTRHKEPPPKPVVKKIVKPIPSKTVASTLSGLQVDPSTNARPVTAVMIENSLDARPQSGLSEAKVVFEAIAEGGITRFLALFQDTAPADIGPVRSARPYYIQWAMGFDAGYAHVGGSPEALADIRNWGVKDLDQFANSGSYHRVGSRIAPHNVYTSMAALNQLEASKGYTTSAFTGFARKNPAPSKAPNAKTINIAISGALYNVHYDYNPATNTYHRSEGGAGHFDANGNKLITPDVVVVLTVPYGLAADNHHSEYAVVGSGQAFIFQDGILTNAQWSKASDKSQLMFTDAAGKPIGLNPGQTWITAVGNPTNVSSAP